MPLEEIKTLSDIFDAVEKENPLLDKEYAQEQIDKFSKKSIKTHTEKLAEGI